MANTIEKAGTATALALATAIGASSGALAESPAQNTGPGTIVDTNEMFQPSLACNIYQTVEMAIQNDPATIEKVREELSNVQGEVNFDSLGENLEANSYDWVTKNPEEAVSELGLNEDTVNELPTIRELYLGDLPEEYCPIPEIEIFTSDSVESVDTITPEEVTE